MNNNNNKSKVKKTLNKILNSKINFLNSKIIKVNLEDFL